MKLFVDSFDIPTILHEKLQEQQQKYMYNFFLPKLVSYASKFNLDKHYSANLKSIKVLP